MMIEAEIASDKATSTCTGNKTAAVKKRKKSTSSRSSTPRVDPEATTMTS